MSSDNGATWVSRSSGLPTLTQTNTNTQVTSLAVIGTNLFAGTGNGVFESTDNGTSWARVNNGSPGLICSLAARGTELFAGTFLDGVYRSNNNGATWTHAQIGSNVSVMSLCVVGTNVFAGTWAGGESAYILSNSDSSWRATGMAGTTYVTSFAADNGILFAGTLSYSVWRRPISELLTGTKSKTDDIPNNFALMQNYPNPFNPSTAISYQLPANSVVTLRVYDVLGKEIRTLVNERQNAGTYTIRFDGSGLPSGVYFYRLQAGNYSATKKLLFMK